MKTALLALALCLITTNAQAVKIAKADDTAIRTIAENFTKAWNNHDAKTLASFWAEDGTLINPAGRVANGRAEIETLFTEEHSTHLKNSQGTMTVSSVQWIKPDVAVVDHDMILNGMTSLDGKALPETKMHVVTTNVKKAGKWWVASCRPYAFLPPPHQKEARTNANSTETN